MQLGEGHTEPVHWGRSDVTGVCAERAGFALDLIEQLSWYLGWQVVSIFRLPIIESTGPAFLQ